MATFGNRWYRRTISTCAPYQRHVRMLYWISADRAVSRGDDCCDGHDDDKSGQPWVAAGSPLA